MDTDWICTQAIAFDDQSTNDVGTVKNFGCLILNDKEDDEKYILHEGDNTIGRHPLNNIYVEHPSVSMYHAVIQCDSDGVVLLDKGSLNKTKLNKKTLRKDVAYFLDEDSSILFGEVQANYYVDVENSNIDNKIIKNECGSKDCVTGNTNLSKLKTPNTATQLIKPIEDDKTNEVTNCQQQSVTNCEGDIPSKAVLHNSRTSTIIEKSNLQNALSNTNHSSPSDELLLNAISQVETSESTILDREDTPSPVLDLKDEFSDTFSLPAFNTTNCTGEDLITTLNDGNDRSKFDTPNEISREDTPSPVMDLGLVANSESVLSTQYSGSKANNACEDTQLFELENDIFDCPTQMQTTDESTTNEEKKETQMNDCSPHKNIESNEQRELSKQNVTSIQDEETQIVHIDDDGLFNCSQPEEIESTSLNKYNDKENENITKPDIAFKTNTSSFHEIETQIVSLDDDFFDCHTQKVIAKNDSIENSSKTSEKDLKPTNNLNTLNTSMFSEMDTQLAEMDNDFFDCPTQKIIPTKSVCSAKKADTQNVEIINDNETINNCNKYVNTFEADDDDIFNCLTQKVVKPTNDESVCVKRFKPVTKSTLSESCNKDENLELEQDDFFNCPTQKISHSKVDSVKTESTAARNNANSNNYFEADDDDIFSGLINNKASTSNQIYENKTRNDVFKCPSPAFALRKSVDFHDAETQAISFGVKSQSPNATTSKHCSLPDNNINQAIEMDDDDDFFNCPTQKLPSTKHARQSSDFRPIKPEKSSAVTFNQNIIVHNISGINSATSDDNEDMFDCPTQKISTLASTVNSLKNVSKEDETQVVLESGQVNATAFSTRKIINEEETQVIDMCDNDFFDCPTQKVVSKIEKNVDRILNKPINNLVDTEEETQLLTEDDDIFNCPTQKIPLSCKNKSLTTDMSKTTIHEAETQQVSSSDKFDEDDDFFVCPTQKMTSKTRVEPTPSSLVLEKKHQLETQIASPIKLHKFSKPSTCNDEDDDFFNCATQKISLNSKVKPTTIDNTNKIGMHEAETQLLTSPLKSDNSTNNIRDKISDKDDDFFNCPTQKISLNVKPTKEITKTIDMHRTERQQLSSPIKLDNFSKPQNEDDDDVFNCPTQKIIFQENKNTVVNSKNTSETYDLPTLKRNVSSTGAGDSKTSSVPLIRIRNDLHAPCKRDKILKLSNKPNKTVNNVSNTSDIKLGTENSNSSPRRSKRSFKGKLNHYGSIDNTSIIKQEPIDSDLGESRVSSTSKNTPLLKHMDESIYSPFNVVNASVDSTMKSKTVNNVSLPNSESSTSDDAVKWQSFWNKKKSKSLESKSNRMGQSTSKVVHNDEVVVKKQRYQTRAVTKQENGCEDVSRKRKLDLPSEESNKRSCNNEKQCKIRILPFKKSSPTIDERICGKTGGFVTDEITQCTILVTDKIRCTMKILSAIARGCPIVSTSWIKHSYAVKAFQDVDDFIIKDNDAERKYNFRLTESLSRARTKGLLDGYTVLITPSVKPRDMKVIVTCAGGTHVLNWPKTSIEKTLIVTCEHDRQNWKAIWDIEGASTVDSDILVTSIIRQRLHL